MNDKPLLRIGMQGIYRHRPFTIAGRLMLRDEEDATWNEWRMLFQDGTSGWLSDGGESCAVMIERDIPEIETLPAFEALRPDQELELSRRYYTVTNRYIAVYTGVEGDPAIEVESGAEVRAADLDGAGAECAAIDYSELPPTVFIGEYIDLESLNLY